MMSEEQKNIAVTIGAIAWDGEPLPTGKYTLGIFDTKECEGNPGVYEYDLSEIKAISEEQKILYIYNRPLDRLQTFFGITCVYFYDSKQYAGTLDGKLNENKDILRADFKNLLGAIADFKNVLDSIKESSEKSYRERAKDMEGVARRCEELGHPYGYSIFEMLTAALNSDHVPEILKEVIKEIIDNYK